MAQPTSTSVEHQLPSARLSADNTEVDSAMSPHDNFEKSDHTTDHVATDDKQHGQDEAPKVYPGAFKLTLIMFALCLSIFLVALDQTIIAPALGAITAHFKSTKDIGWYGSSYLLTSTCLTPMFGIIYKLFNVKWTYLGAILLFELGSLVSAVAPSSTAFIVGRAVAGMGTAGLFSGSIVILSHALPLNKRPMAFGLVGGMWGIASVAGPLLGGAFTENVTWRWCFYINLPIGAISIAIVMFTVHLNRNSNDFDHLTWFERFKQIDFYGASMFIPGIICMLLALQWGGVDYAWGSSRIIGLFVGAGVMLAIFVGIQIWRGDQSTLPPFLFKNRSVAAAMAFCFFFGAGFFPLIYYLSLYFQAIQGVSAVQAGIKILPLLLATVLCSVVSGGLVSSIGYYNFIIVPCMILFSVGSGMITTWTVDTPIREWFGYQVLAGLGIGAGFQIGPIVVQTVLPIEWVPVGTACVQFFQSLGGAIFIAVAQTTFQNGFIQKLKEDNIGISADVFLNSGASQVREILKNMHREDAIPSVLEAYMKGLRNTYYISLAMALCALVSVSALEWKSVKKGPDGKKNDAPIVAV